MLSVLDAKVLFLVDKFKLCWNFLDQSDYSHGILKLRVLLRPIGCSSFKENVFVLPATKFRLVKILISHFNY